MIWIVSLCTIDQSGQNTICRSCCTSLKENEDPIQGINIIKHLLSFLFVWFFFFVPSLLPSLYVYILIVSSRSCSKFSSSSSLIYLYSLRTLLSVYFYFYFYFFMFIQISFKVLVERKCVTSMSIFHRVILLAHGRCSERIFE